MRGVDRQHLGGHRERLIRTVPLLLLVARDLPERCERLCVGRVPVRRVRCEELSQIAGLPLAPGALVALQPVAEGVIVHRIGR
jgi:hypothetical protein